MWAKASNLSGDTPKAFSEIQAFVLEREGDCLNTTGVGISASMLVSHFMMEHERNSHENQD